MPRGVQVRVLFSVLAYANGNDNLVAVDVGIPSDDLGYSIAVKKGNTELVDFINPVLKDLKDSGKIEEFVVDAQELAGPEE